MAWQVDFSLEFQEWGGAFAPPEPPQPTGLQGAWPRKPQFSIRGWPPAWLQNGTSRTVLLCPGYGADLPSPSFDQQSNASGGPVLASVTQPSP